mmetsp:Transcript_25292/g.55039  ORF Transcript_25292/g.55039 Transcript_25292/m.55039 type:complete len:84 (-) Transcript_25292:106-357(-)
MVVEAVVQSPEVAAVVVHGATIGGRSDASSAMEMVSAMWDQFLTTRVQVSAASSAKTATPAVVPEPCVSCGLRTLHTKCFYIP